MIRYDITRQELYDRIQQESPRWLAQAKQKTSRFKAAKAYTEKTGSWSVVKPVYIALQHGKCAYCERLLEEGPLGTIEWDVEHFRPKSRVRVWRPVDSSLKELFKFNTGPASHRGYYLLPYQPLNYLATCKVCNSPLKSDYFPIAAKRRLTAVADPERMTKEEPFLIYPIGCFDEDPEDLITFHGFLCVPSISRGPRRRRAFVVIAFFQLNERDTLMKARAGVILATFAMLERLEANPQDRLGVTYMTRMALPAFEHANCARSFVTTYRENIGLARAYVEKAIDYLSSV